MVAANLEGGMAVAVEARGAHAVEDAEVQRVGCLVVVASVPVGLEVAPAVAVKEVVVKVVMAAVVMATAMGVAARAGMMEVAVMEAAGTVEIAAVAVTEAAAEVATLVAA